MAAQPASIDFDINGEVRAISVPESHVDLMGNTTFTVEQLARRWKRESEKPGHRRAEQFKDLNQWKDNIPEGHPAVSQKNLDGINAFASLTLQCQENLAADLAKNELLKSAIAYEQAQRDVAYWQLKIDGRDERLEVPEETDPETGEVTQEYVSYLSPIEPIPQTIDTLDEDGDPVTVDNPTYLEAVAARDAAQSVIDAASQNTIDLVAARSSDSALASTLMLHALDSGGSEETTADPETQSSLETLFNGG